MSRLLPAAHSLPLLIVLCASLAVSCSGKGGQRDPASPAAPEPGDPAAPGPDSWQGSMIGYLSGILHPDGTVELDELARTGEAIGDTFDLDATEFFNRSPCRDCLTLGGITRDGGGNIRLPFTVRHPFALGQNNRYDLHIFDLRGILIAGGTTQFPGIGTIPINTNSSWNTPAFSEQIPQGDPRLVLNADGYTSQFDWQAANPDHGHPRDIPGNLNPFKRFFVDETNSPFDPLAPIGWNVLPMGSLEQTQEYILSGTRLAALGPIPFAFVLDACYGQSATFSTRSNPSYFLPEFNRKEAVEVDVEVISNNLQVGDKTSRCVIEVTAKDWQELSSVNGSFPANNLGNTVRYASQIEEVRATIPGLSFGYSVATQPTGGGGSMSNPWQYQLMLRNETQNTTLGPVYGLVAVRDQLFNIVNSGPQGIPGPATPQGVPKAGMNIKDYTAYQYFQTNVGPAVDDPPIADLSLTTPRQVLSGATVMLNAVLSEDDIGITTWEFDPEGTGTWIDNTAAIPPWEFDHVYTTPVNTQTIYNAAVRVTDTSGQSATTAIQISVTTTPDAAPVAVITPPANPWEILTGDSTNINGSASSDDFGIIRYEMNPGDGTGWIDNGLNPVLNHTYNAPGVTTVYTVELRVTDTAMQTATTSRPLTVIVIDDPPVADLQANPLSGDAPLLVNFDASGSTDDNAVVEYRMDFGDGGGFTAWQPSPFFSYTYAPFLDQLFTATVQVRDASLQTDSETIDINVTVPGGCLITGVTGPAALNVGESANFTLTGVGVVVYQWTESSPNIQFVGPTNGPTVTVLATSASASIGSTTFTISGNAGTCTFNADITVFDLLVTGPAHSQQYVNRDENVNTTDAIGTLVSMDASVVPAIAGVNVTFNFQDPDEPSYQYIDGSGVQSAETDTDANDNRGDVRRPDGSANPLEPLSTKYQNGFEETPGPVYVSQTIRSSSVLGVASTVFKTSRFGGDNYTFSASADPAGNGFQISRSMPGTLTVWRWYGVPVYSMWDSGNTNNLFYLPEYSLVNSQFGPAYIHFNFSPPGGGSPPTPQGYGGMVYTNPIPATFAGQATNYIDVVGSYNAPAEAYTVGNGNKVKPNLISFGLNEYNPAGVIGLCTASFNPLLVPPPTLSIASKPYSTTDYVGCARGRMNGLGFSALNQSKVFTHELGHALGLNHSDTGSAGSDPETVKFGAAGVGIMRPSVNTTEAPLWTFSELDFMRGVDRDVTNNEIMRGPYYEGG